MEIKNTVEWEAKAISQLRRIDKRYAAAIIAKTEMLAGFPDVHLDIKHLNGSNYRLRHGDYRVFFEVCNGVPKVIRIQQVRRRQSTTYRH